jgi:hypothetical protein
LDGLEPIILEIEVYNPATVHALRQQTADGVEKQEGLAATAHTAKANHFAGIGGQRQFARPTFRQRPVDELVQDIFQTVTIHRDDTSTIRPSMQGRIYIQQSNVVLPFFHHTEIGERPH